MRKTISKIKRFVQDNKWLLAALIVIGFCIFSRFWFWSLTVCAADKASVYHMLEERLQEEMFEGYRCL